MRVFNFTFNKYPARTAEAIYTREVSRGFSENIGNNFLLIVGNDASTELTLIPHFVIRFKRRRWRTAYYFFWIPYFIIFGAKATKGSCFFSNDQFLLSSLIIWKKILRFQSIICADWHMFSKSWKDRFIAKNATIHITTTKHLRKQIVDVLGASEANVFTVHGGVSEDAFKMDETKQALRAKLDLPQEVVLVGYVGLFRTLGMEKGIDTMIQSLACLSDEVQMVFVGGKGKEIDFYKNLAKENNVATRCIFIDMVSSEKVLQYQKALDVLVIPYPDMPHFRDYGFPMKVYEYMASGVPIAYSNLPIIDEVLQGYGTPFQPGNALLLAETIDGMIKNPAVIKEMAKMARAKAKEFTWKEKAKSIVNYILQYEK